METLKPSEILQNKAHYLGREVRLNGFLTIFGYSYLFLEESNHDNPLPHADSIFIALWAEVLRSSVFKFFVQEKYSKTDDYPVYRLEASVTGTVAEFHSEIAALELTNVKQITLESEHDERYQAAFASPLMYDVQIKPLIDKLGFCLATVRIGMLVAEYPANEILETNIIKPVHEGQWVKITGNLHCRYPIIARKRYEYFSVLDTEEKLITLVPQVYDYKMRELWTWYWPIGGRAPALAGFQVELIGKIRRITKDELFYQADKPEPQWALDDLRHILIQRSEEYDLAEYKHP